MLSRRGLAYFNLTHAHPLPPPLTQLTGFLLVNRVPGNFHIEARSKYHNLNPTLTNVSHVVHDLTFGPPMTPDYRSKLHVRVCVGWWWGWIRVVGGASCMYVNQPAPLHHTTQLLPKEFQQMESPLAHSPFATAAIHQAYHHYLKARSAHAFVYVLSLRPSCLSFFGVFGGARRLMFWYTHN